MKTMILVLVFVATGVFLGTYLARTVNQAEANRRAHLDARGEQSRREGAAEIHKTINGRYVNYRSYTSIVPGMFLSDVVDIIGGHGTEVASNYQSDGTGGRIETKVYSWTNLDGSNITATFQNFLLVSKAQSGLR